MEHICVNELFDPRLRMLFQACFNERSGSFAEARHLARFFLEYKLVEHSSDQEEQYKSELREDEDFRRDYGDLSLYSGEFIYSEIEKFVQNLLKEFLTRPQDRVWLSLLLKSAGSVGGVQGEISEFVKTSWRIDESAADHALDIIWDAEIIRGLQKTLVEIANEATDEVLRDHASQLLRVADVLSKEGVPSQDKEE